MAERVLGKDEVSSSILDIGSSQAPTGSRDVRVGPDAPRKQ
jgi:hypothetical protein